MLRFKQFINEELTDKQKRAVAGWTNNFYTGSDHKINSQKAVELSKHIIPEGQHHLIIPVSNPKTHENIEKHLSNHDIKIHNYEEGKALDKYGRQVNIGKVLAKTKAPQKLLDDYASGTRSSLKDYEIVISRHPFHVAEGSTRKKWSSCAKMSSSANPKTMTDAAKKMPKEIEHGTHVAYLVKKEKDPVDLQTRIDKSVGRIYLKPHVSESGHTVLRPETKIYTSLKNKPEEFYDAVHDFSEQHFPMKDGELYKKHSDVYNDDGNTVKFNMNKKSISKLLGKLDEYDLDKVARTSKLSNDTIKHLIDHSYDLDKDRQQMLINKLAQRNDLSKSNIDKLLSHPKIIPTHLAFNDNLTSDHIHKIIDDALKTDDMLHKIYEKKPAKNHYDSGSYSPHLHALFNRKNFNKDHLDRLTDIKDARFHTKVLQNNLYDLNHIAKIKERFHDYEPKVYDDNIHRELKASENFIRDRLDKGKQV